MLNKVLKLIIVFFSLAAGIIFVLIGLQGAFGWDWFGTVSSFGLGSIAAFSVAGAICLIAAAIGSNR